MVFTEGLQPIQDTKEWKFEYFDAIAHKDLNNWQNQMMFRDFIY